MGFSVAIHKKKVSGSMAKKMALTPPGDLAARYGGGEFILLLPNTSPKGVRRIGEDVRHRVEVLRIQHARTASMDCVTVSVGAVSLIPDRGMSPQHPIELADNALY